MLLRLLFLCLFCTAATGACAQLITVAPAFPQPTDAVTIIFDATEGNGGLADCNCDVYIHTGVITENSTTPSDWKYVETVWGQANAAWQLTPVAGEPNKYSYTFGPSVRAYYGVPDDEEILRLAMVFRNGDGSLEGKAEGNADIFVDLQPEGAELATSLTSPSVGNLNLALGQTVTVVGAASAPSRLSIVDNGTERIVVEDATELTYELTATEAGDHEVLFIAMTETAADTSRFTYTAALRVDLTAPTLGVVQIFPGGTVDVAATSYITSDLTISANGTDLATADNSTTIDETLTFSVPGIYTVSVTADYNGQTVENSFVLIVNASVPIVDPPPGNRDGITYVTDSSVRLQLNAPGKNNVVVIGTFSNWLPRAQYLMKKSADGGTFWIDIDGLTPGQNYSYQYLVDGELRVADPLSEVVLDPWNDPFIPESVYPNLPEYPYGETEGIVTLLQPGAAAYTWQVDDFTPPDQEELVIYELLLRDFLESHDYSTLIDTLDYLDNLGINAIELMPVSEFEGNISWGYNPSFHMALDKYYGPASELKRFVDAAHERGIAVILDVVYNHAFSQSPLAQLYWNPELSRPTPNNPWLNVEARHPFNVGYDFNHDSEHTVRYVDRVMQYWLEAFRVDGFRFDLSKGFTQRMSTDIGGWNAYDAGRIANIKHYVDVCWAVNPDAYMIMEHFADNTEEIELQDYGNGMLFWAGGGVHFQYQEAALGYNSNLSGVTAESRGWNNRHLISYIESHDEERTIYKTNNFGNSEGDYDITETVTGLRRAELTNVFFYPIPGPKMLWQFGELGYDYSINYCADGSIQDFCRVDPKPIRWDYFDSPNRRRLYNVTSAVINLRRDHPVFQTDDLFLDLNSMTKRIHLNDASMDVAIVGNFDVVEQSVSDPFQHDGWWYEYFTGDSLNVTDPAAALSLAPGEYRLYTTERLATPPGGFVSSTREVVTDVFDLRVAPNPVTDQVRFAYALPQSAAVSVRLVDLLGHTVVTAPRQQLASGWQQGTIGVSHLPHGMYLLQISANGKVQTERVLVLRP